MMDFNFSVAPDSPPDQLFQERLDTFMERSLADIQAFADRESRSFEETRRLVAEWHSKYLFQPTFEDATLQHDNAAKVRSVLYDVSKMLETLFEVAGIQSFVLAVDPLSTSDAGFLGGTVIGREYWRGLRGGGDAGAKGFKAFCLRDLEMSFPQIPRPEPSPFDSSTLPAKLPRAKSLKNELYDGVRKALRSVSGVRNAEMKWTNHDRLDVYGVRVIGWPTEIPAANPSSLKAFQNKILLDCLENGTLRFEKLFIETSTSPVPPNELTVTIVEEEPAVQDMKGPDRVTWVYDANSDDPNLASPAEPIGTLVPAIETVANASPIPHIEDTFWQVPEDPSLNGDLWNDLDISSIIQSALDGSSYGSRKRPRSETDFDDLL